MVWCCGVVAGRNGEGEPGQGLKVNDEGVGEGDGGGGDSGLDREGVIGRGLEEFGWKKGLFGQGVQRDVENVRRDGWGDGQEDRRRGGG